MTEMIFEPQQGAQTRFFTNKADILIYGGAAGGGKSFALLLEALRNISVKNFSAIIFRRTYPQIRAPGGLWDKAAEIYTQIGGKPTGESFYFDIGTYKTEIAFSHLQHEKDKYNFQGAEIPLICFDELTHFTESQFFYLLSRNRSTCGVRPYIRATTNPEPSSWVKKLIQYWIDEKTGLPIKERAGKVRYFFRESEKYTWGNSPEEVIKSNPAAKLELIKSLSFIPATLEDNKILNQKDPNYRANLQALDSYNRELLLNGNWNAKKITGEIFRNPKFSQWDFSQANKGFIDPAYGGKNNTALTIGRKEDGLYFCIGYTWNKSIEALYRDILIKCAGNNVLQLFIENNKDEGISRNQMDAERKKLIGENGIPQEIKICLSALKIIPKRTTLNKHIKIVTYGAKFWENTIWGSNTQAEYIENLLNYVEGQEPDDEADSFASLVKELESGFVFNGVKAN
jgi:hypothetical protein